MIYSTVVRQIGATFILFAASLCWATPASANCPKTLSGKFAGVDNYITYQDGTLTPLSQVGGIRVISFNSKNNTITATAIGTEMVLSVGTNQYNHSYTGTFSYSSSHCFGTISQTLVGSNPATTTTEFFTLADNGSKLMLSFAGLSTDPLAFQPNSAVYDAIGNCPTSLSGTFTGATTYTVYLPVSYALSAPLGTGVNVSTTTYNPNGTQTGDYGGQAAWVYGGAPDISTFTPNSNAPGTFTFSSSTCMGSSTFYGNGGVQFTHGFVVTMNGGKIFSTPLIAQYSPALTLFISDYSAFRQ